MGTSARQRVGTNPSNSKSSKVASVYDFAADIQIMHCIWVCFSSQVVTFESLKLTLPEELGCHSGNFHLVVLITC